MDPGPAQDILKTRAIFRKAPLNQVLYNILNTFYICLHILFKIYIFMDRLRIAKLISYLDTIYYYYYYKDYVLKLFL